MLRWMRSLLSRWFPRARAPEVEQPERVEVDAYACPVTLSPEALRMRAEGAAPLPQRPPPPPKPALHGSLRDRVQAARGR